MRPAQNGQSRAEVAEMLTQKRDDSTKGGPSTSVLITESPISSGALLSSAPESSTSPIPSDSTPPTLISTPETRFRANLGYYRSQLPQLLDAILIRDCLSFCPINKEDFTRDFESGFGQNCSTSLLDSLLALTTLLAPERLAVVKASLSGSNQQEDLGDTFAQEAITALYNGTGLPQRIADIQALGILALYCLGCGKMKDGLGFAGDYGAAITEQWATTQSEPIFADRQTCANIYCAAISFNRVLFLIQDYNNTLDNLSGKVGIQRPSLYENSSGDSVHGNSNLSGSIIDDAFFARDLSELPNNPKVVAAKIFEFTEWVYKARYRIEEKSFERAMNVYQDGLRWYESFFAYTTSCSNDTPLILFSHTYYHFCVLCLLTPYVFESAGVAADGTVPEVVCKQAASSIGELIQHYSKLYNDGQLLDFMPFFKMAALAFLEICEAKKPQ
ncbi:hypothetical protein NLG97_g3444 [Lecanicillium saksenae]|uniref:Uncharacterized protein n=1 Tax=Lecanicillium saksenae TaxID=468837 RepID=A0ACC1QY23_9HYPO|nr:hypothetical protein NLG97_g3444 [Lecanicillium saksenae]